jgi:hypothetical protein
MLLFTFYKRSEIAIFMVGYDKIEDSKGIVSKNRHCNEKIQKYKQWSTNHYTEN